MKELPENALRIHLGLILAEAICVSAFVIELLRALSGNTLSWAYVFEWPILGGYAIYVWRKLLRTEDGDTTTTPAPTPSETDALDRYNRFLADVHRGDPAPPTGE
ncbi:MAG: hypothetical protein ACHQFZ_09490 [Acidimicrobiales bacterium]